MRNGRAIRKTNQHPDTTRDALLAAARNLFGRQGYAETSLDEIVTTAGVTKGALYHYFSNKQQLFFHVFMDVRRELSREVFPIDVENNDVWNDLLRRCRNFIEKHTQPQVQRIVLIDARSVLSWDDWHKVDSEYGIVLLRAGLRRAMHHGIIETHPLNSLALMLVGAMNEACMFVINAEDRDAALEEAVTIMARLLQGLRPPPPSEDAARQRNRSMRI
ncbi:MAG: TetR/AcrR family transcriptional regulator [Alphaproteobacteria bacterium]